MAVTTTLAQPDASTLVERGHAFLAADNHAAAAETFLQAIAADDGCAMAHNNLGWASERLGRPDQAIASYRRAISIDGDLVLARVNLASLLATESRPREAVELWRPLISEGLFDRRLVDEAIGAALAMGDAAQAASWAAISSILTRGSHHLPSADALALANAEPIPAMLCGRTLAHDIAQIDYLARRGVCDLDLDEMSARYHQVLAAFESAGDPARRPLTDGERRLIGHTYGRLWRLRPTPGLGASRLLGDWDAAAQERTYRDSALGICVIDDFLAPDTLHEIRQFCLESAVWLSNHYRHGRLGAFFREGFNCPLLIDLAEEIIQAFPKLIGDTHKLLQLWGFKYSPDQPATNAHADFAAVNLNFWITPDDANLDPTSGGLVIYDVEAPPNWTHEDYNRNGREISTFLRRSRARPLYIPYRANRAVIFNSDLFHATAPLQFRPDYENRRINVTLLFGRRLEDTKHPIRRP